MDSVSTLHHFLEEESLLTNLTGQGVRKIVGFVAHNFSYPLSCWVTEFFLVIGDMKAKDNKGLHTLTRRARCGHDSQGQAWVQY